MIDKFNEEFKMIREGDPPSRIYVDPNRHGLQLDGTVNIDLIN
jgi:hypothetical protein